MIGKHTSSENRFVGWAGVAILVALAAWTAPPAFGSGTVVAEVGEPFEVNGEIYPASRLSVKTVAVLTPVSSLHEIRIDGDCRGLVLVRSNDDDTAARSELGFARAEEGHLVLTSVAIAGSPEGTVYAYLPGSGQWSAAPPARMPAAAPLEIAFND